MIEHLPTAVLVGMADPQGWVDQLTAALIWSFPGAPPVQHRACNGRTVLTWHTQVGGRDQCSIWFWVYTDHVAVTIWSACWAGTNIIGQSVYCALLRTVVTTLIDQYTDPDGPAVHLQMPGIAVD